MNQEAVFDQDQQLLYPNVSTRLNNDVCLLAPDLPIVAFADGCGCSNASHNAACIATKEAVDHMQQTWIQANTLQQVARQQIEALKKAQTSLEKNETAIGGSTTLTQVAIVQDYAVITHLGDSKVFILRRNDTDLEVFEPTAGSRGNIANAADCGGRLDSASPFDLRNLGISVTKITPGDLILIASDGIHDCLDPEICGIDPPVEGWTEANKASYMTNKLQTLVKDCESTQGMDKAIDTYLQDITFNNKVHILTEQGRVPSDYKAYPGKPDHASRIWIEYRG